MEVTITVDETAVTVTEDTTTINITPTTYEVSIEAVATLIPTALSMSVTPYKTITKTNVQEALEELADQDFRGTTAPTGSNLELGDTWYDTANDIFYVYRTVGGITDWYPLLNTDVGEEDNLDGGAF
jgi:hypothetical protein